MPEPGQGGRPRARPDGHRRPGRAPPASAPSSAWSSPTGGSSRVAVLDQLAMVNLHFSLLPRWRGAAPVERALLEGDAETGVCLMAVEAGLDTGAVYAVEATDHRARGVGRRAAGPAGRHRLPAARGASGRRAGRTPRTPRPGRQPDLRRQAACPTSSSSTGPGRRSTCDGWSGSVGRGRRSGAGGSGCWPPVRPRPIRRRGHARSRRTAGHRGGRGRGTADRSLRDRPARGQAADGRGGLAERCAPGARRPARRLTNAFPGPIRMPGAICGEGVASIRHRWCDGLPSAPRAAIGVVVMPMVDIVRVRSEGPRSSGAHVVRVSARRHAVDRSRFRPVDRRIQVNGGWQDEHFVTRRTRPTMRCSTVRIGQAVH